MSSFLHSALLANEYDLSVSGLLGGLYWFLFHPHVPYAKDIRMRLGSTGRQMTEDLSPQGFMEVDRLLKIPESKLAQGLTN